MKHTPLTILALLGLVLVGCSGPDDQAEEQPISESEQQAQQNVEASNAAYEDTYPEAQSHLIEEYGIVETGELCRESTDLEQRDTLVENIMADAEIQIEGTTREDPEYRGAFDATDDALYELCEEYND